MHLRRCFMAKYLNKLQSFMMLFETAKTVFHIWSTVYDVVLMTSANFLILVIKLAFARVRDS